MKIIARMFSRFTGQGENTPDAFDLRLTGLVVAPQGRRDHVAPVLFRRSLKNA
ncbi:MAG: hypothetical protein WBH04_16115 [Albidovulum sp.]